MCLYSKTATCFGLERPTVYRHNVLQNNAKCNAYGFTIYIYIYSAFSVWDHIILQLWPIRP